MKREILKLYLGGYAMHGSTRIHVCGMNTNSDKIQNILGEETIPINEIKLLLRPLSSMTEEEAIEHQKLARFNQREDWAFIKSQAEATKYLLSRGIDLFGLIEKGEAIDSTKL